MKIWQNKIGVGVIGYYLLATAALVGFEAVAGPPNANPESLAQREYSDLQKDEGSLISDINRLRRDLRARASVVAVAKERNFVRDDLLNIVYDRMGSAAQWQDLARDEDLATLVGQSFAAPAQEYKPPASRS